jgi:hypothetical protein
VLKSISGGESANPFKTYSNGIPTTGVWKSGDVVDDQTPTASGNIGWVCITSSVITAGTITSGSTSLTVGTGTGINNGDYVTVAGAGVAGANLITTVSSGGGTSTLILVASASTGVVDAKVTTPGVWKVYGVISA